MAKVFFFNKFTLDTGAYELRRGAKVIPVEPLVLDLIRLLLEHPGEVLSRDRLMDAVWEGRIVSESTISTAIKSARKALGDTGRDQNIIRTIRGRGIQFTASVTLDEAEKAPSFSDIVIQPALYIRPFDTMGGEGLESLSCALRVRTRSVLARMPLLRIASPIPEADGLVDPRQFRSRFGLTHVLEVRLQRTAGVLIADASLTETRNGFQIWAQQTEVSTGPAEQETLLQKMIRRLEPELMQAMVAELQAVPGAGNARARLLQAIAVLALKGWHQTTFEEAMHMIERAIEEEPDLALSHAYLALLKALGHRVGILRNDDAIVPAAIAAAERALALENRDSTILGLVGCALADAGQVDRAVPILWKAIDADPQNGHAKTALGSALMLKGDHAAAVQHLADGIAISPADSRLSVWGAVLALGHLGMGNLDAALAAAENACREDDRIYLPRLALTAVHLKREDPTHAIAAARECLRTNPDLHWDEVRCFVGKGLGARVWALVEQLRG